MHRGFEFQHLLYIRLSSSLPSISLSLSPACLGLAFLAHRMESLSAPTVLVRDIDTSPAALSEEVNFTAIVAVGSAASAIESESTD